jgi:hypothetical protein
MRPNHTHRKNDVMLPLIDNMFLIYEMVYMLVLLFMLCALSAGQ